MQDVLAKLKEIQENYDNEDIQRAITAAEETAVAEEVVEEETVEEATDEVVDEAEETVEEDSVEETLHEDDEQALMRQLMRKDGIDPDKVSDGGIFDKYRTMARKQLGLDESKVEEDSVEETVEVPISALSELMRLAGYKDYKIDEYANEPDEEYKDAEDQLIGLSGGLNRPKKMYPASATGDNPMDQEPREIEENIESVSQSLYKSYKDFLEEVNKDD